MIFVTIDAPLSFGRLVQMVDEWTGRHPKKQIFVLSGDGRFTFRHCESTSFTSPDEWERLSQSAGRVISHAGIGTIIKSLEFAKPLVPLMKVPRKALLGERRNDHQYATAARFSGFDNISIVDDARELASVISALALESPAGSGDRKSSPSLEMLISKIKRFAHDHC